MASMQVEEIAPGPSLFVSSSPTVQGIGREFVHQYYSLLGIAPELVHRFFDHESIFVYGTDADVVVGQTAIQNKIRDIGYDQCWTSIRDLNITETLGNGVVVQVAGEISVAGGLMRRFVQTFVLAPPSQNYYIRSDIFRYEDESALDTFGNEDGAQSESSFDLKDQSAKMNPDTKFVHFTMDWKMRWNEVLRFKHGPEDACNRKDFVTAHNNIPLRWNAEMQQWYGDDGTASRLNIYYKDGPMEKIDGVECEFGIVKGDGTMRVIQQMSSLSANRGCCQGFTFERDCSAFGDDRYGLGDTDRLVFQLKVKIPVDTFSYAMPMPIPKPSAPFLVEMFTTIDDPNNSSYSDVKLISRDGIVFYCHKNVISAQSEPLATLFRDPPATNTNNESAPSTENQPKKKGEYEFPEMAGASLKSMLEYLYTGKATMLVNLTVSEVIEVAKEADKYSLKPLKESCGADLWKRVVDEPYMAIEIVRFADLHADLKWLKFRAFDVIAENEDDTPRDMASHFDGWSIREEELRGEFINYIFFFERRSFTS